MNDMNDIICQLLSTLCPRLWFWFILYISFFLDSNNDWCYHQSQYYINNAHVNINFLCSASNMHT